MLHLKKIMAGAFLATLPLSVSAENYHAIKTGTFNLHHSKNLEDLQSLEKSLPENLDFLFLQEVKFWKGGTENTAKILAHDLNLNVSATKRSSDSEGIALLSRAPIEKSATLEYRAQTSPFLLGFKRRALMSLISSGASKILLVNTHLTNWGFETHIRRKQIAETLVWIKNLVAQESPDLVFLGGDFNAVIDSSEMQQIASFEIAPGLFFENHNSQVPTMDGEKGKRIDFIFVASRKNIRFLKEDILSSFSDHRHPLQDYEIAEP